MTGIFAYGWRAWRTAKNDSASSAIHLGFHVALLTALVNAVADLYFFRLDFHASITWFWLIVALCVASSRLVISEAHAANPSDLSPVKRPLQ
jgi:hypothetical protein